MLHEAVSRYHELLAKENVAEESRALLDDGLERSKLIFGGRRLSPYLRPHFVLEEDFRAHHNDLRDGVVGDPEGEGCRPRGPLDH